MNRLKQKIPTPSNKAPLYFEDINESANDKSMMRKTNYSKWHILINSNVAKANEEDDKAIAVSMKRCVLDLFSNHQDEVFFIKKKARGTHEINNDTIGEIEVRSAAEIGSKKHRIHLHTLVFVTHYTLLQLDIPNIRKLLDECFLRENPVIKNYFLRVKWIPVDKPIEDYLEKMPLPAPLKSKDDEILENFANLSIK